MLTQFLSGNVNPPPMIKFSQINTVAGTIQGREDCLILNVFSPQNPAEETTRLRPVMVFIHGGYFFQGSNEIAFYGAQRFLDEDVVSFSPTSVSEQEQKQPFFGN